MTWLVVYTRPGGVFPAWHEFAYRQAADDWVDLCRAGGWEAKVVEVGGDSGSEPSSGARSADQHEDGCSDVPQVQSRTEAHSATKGDT